MRLFGGHMGGCGENRPTDCCEIIFLLWILNTCGGCGFNFDCNTMIILLLLLTCCGGCNNDCR